MKFLVWSPLAILILTAQTCGDGDVEPPLLDCDDPGLVCHSLEVSRHTSTNLTDERADEILADATRAAREDDGAGDVACEVVLRRDVPVTTFSQGSGIVNSSADFATIIGLPGHVKVVNQINWCGAFSPNIIGCAPVGGASLAVVRFTANQEGILWLHEFGHNETLNHRNSPTRAVMFPSIGVDHDILNATECTALRQPIAVTLTTDAGGSEVEAASVEEFVRRIYYHGLPFEAATRYDGLAVPTLVDMLSDERDEPYWANIVALLGIVGDDATVDTLESFIGADEEPVSPEWYRAASTAVVAFGYLANRAGSDRAIDYLAGGLSPDNWNDRVQWTSPFHETNADRNVELAQLSIIGLALSGRESGLAALRDLQAGPPDSEIMAAAGGLLAEAIEAHGEIGEKGLDGYYSESGR
ncbi:MAG: hypothetical protein E2P02_04635 [Acidobacteria bacterium]|nr:MAG: hypothetical protein E2P02_04635 [Acidobacteriota bacterium]